jgi:hypothetical protein
LQAIELVKLNLTKLLSYTDMDHCNESLLYCLTLSDKSKKWVCMELIEKRLSVDAMLFEQSVLSEKVSGSDMDLILQYVYTDSVASNASNYLPELIRVYSWTLKHTKCVRLMSLLQNALIDQVNTSNVILAINLCDTLNNSRESFQKFVGHCKWLIHSYILNKKQSEVKDLLNNSTIVMDILSSIFEQFQKVSVPDSSFALDTLSLFNSSMGSIVCIVDENASIRVVPAILATTCDYFWNLLSGDWKKTNAINLREFGLDETQIHSASTMELRNRANLLVKLIKYWHGGIFEIEASEVMDALDILKFLVLDSATNNPLYYECLNSAFNGITIETVLPMCSRFISDEELLEPELSPALQKAIEFATKNWMEISERHSIVEINNLCSKVLLQRIIKESFRMHRM